MTRRERNLFTQFFLPIVWL